ncbi:response regulator [Nodularia spumigena]|jgi:DNA-binding NarL/FixJ family response regulator|nr:response regulator transcription factor [Nodularia spumigena]MDB9368335.1 response regulator transcription factor [Nodularia spumigena CS-586/05]MEA5526699.1 response regulator transcription factor [Nodularia spumigena UHCC 0143]MEA5613019.1 response regulator transcription factor [Nodularia spumigena UHCC 0040]
MIRIVIIEDEPLTRMGIKTVIAEDPTMELCGEAECGKKGIILVEETKPDIVLVDIGLPDVNGLDVVCAIKQTSQAGVIIITCESNEYVVLSAFECGADSYLLKQDVKSITYAIHRTYKNERFLDPKITKKLLQNNYKKGLRKGKVYEGKLTGTEIKVLKLIACGLSNQEIANKLFITPNTVKCHISNMYQKINARNRVEAITEGQKLGYLQSNDFLKVNIKEKAI